METAAVLPRPGHPSVRLAPDGEPSIRGFRCDACGAIVPDETIACRSCAARGTVRAFDAGTAGRLHAWTIVHRSYPGVAVPFVSAIVDLDDGPTLKGTLAGVDATALTADLPVTLVFDDAGGAVDKAGAPYVGFHFVPAGRGEAV